MSQGSGPGEWQGQPYGVQSGNQPPGGQNYPGAGYPNNAGDPNAYPPPGYQQQPQAADPSQPQYQQPPPAEQYPASPTPHAGYAPGYPPQPGQFGPPPPPKKHTGAIIGAAVIGSFLLILLVIVGFVLIGGDDAPEPGPTAAPPTQPTQPTPSTQASDPATSSGPTGGPTSNTRDNGLATAAVGACTDIDALSGEVFDIPILECTEPHDGQFVGKFDLDDGPFPGVDPIDTAAQEGCLTAFEEFTGQEYATSDLMLNFITPTKQTWTQMNDREVLCIAYTADGSTVTDSWEDGASTT